MRPMHERQSSSGPAMKSLRCPVMILDGGMGTTLSDSEFNFRFDQSTPLWSSHLLIGASSALQAVHVAFGCAGAEILLTASYQASFEGFEKTLGPQYREREAIDYMKSSISHGLASRKVILEQSTYLPRNIGFDPPSVALSVGPFGATLVPSQEYSGSYPPAMCSQSALEAWHRRRLAAFAGDRAQWDSLEFIAFETFKRIDEIRAVRRVMADYVDGHRDQSQIEAGATRKRWWISTVWPDEVQKAEVGKTVEALLENTDSAKPVDEPYDVPYSTSSSATPWAIGVNCTSLSKVENIVEEMESCVTALAASGRWRSEWPSSSASQRPWLVLYPDGAQGLRYDTGIQQWVPDEERAYNAESWATLLWRIAAAIRARGNWAGIIIGGCCKTGPADIRELRGKLDGEETGTTS